ncbi:MAG: aquaporin Z [Chitinophagales bacterium]|nr:aquaporin Z [Chitinophagales bacterium]MDW8393403.1 aquaporin Z [Chitinophagales bacterium]
MKKNLAEFIGTFWLVMAGCGSGLIAGRFEDLGIGLLGVSLSVGLAVMAMIYAVAHISGAHFNPAVTLGAWAGGRLPAGSIGSYFVSQVLGALVAATVLYLLVTDRGGSIGNFAANGYGEHSPGGYSMTAAIITELVLTFLFVFIILGVTDERAPQGFAGIAIGLALTSAHLISIPVTNTSLNPARSISQAVFVGDWALAQLWLFIVVPLAGGVAAGYAYHYLKQ